MKSNFDEFCSTIENCGEFLRKGSRKWAECKGPNQGAYHREGTAAWWRDIEETLFNRAEGEAEEFNKVGRSEAKETRTAKLNLLLKGKPLEDIVANITRVVVEFGYAANKAGWSRQDRSQHREITNSQVWGIWTATSTNHTEDTVLTKRGKNAIDCQHITMLYSGKDRCKTAR